MEFSFTFPHLLFSISLHSFGAGSPPPERGGVLDSQPRPNTPPIKASWIAVLFFRS